MEAFQQGYVRAVAAAAGAVVVGVPDVDEGVDITLSHTSPMHTASSENKVMLEIQLKSTHTGAVGTDAKVQMDLKRFSYFATPNPTVHKIVVIMRLPADPWNWATADHEDSSLRHCAYWINLSGQTSTAQSPTVTAPSTQIFDDVALCDMMERIGQGGQP